MTLKCPRAPRGDVPPRLAVAQRYCNHSKFNGGRWTPSAYSEILCLDCGTRWRTKSPQVDALPDATPEQGESARFGQHVW